MTWAQGWAVTVHGRLATVEPCAIHTETGAPDWDRYATAEWLDDIDSFAVTLAVYDNEADAEALAEEFNSYREP